jgi:hypothetical protein
MTATTNTVPSLDASSAQRLVRLLGMLGSAHDGEVATAGRKADRLIRERGLNWSQIIAPAAGQTPHDSMDDAF